MNGLFTEFLKSNIFELKGSMLYKEEQINTKYRDLENICEDILNRYPNIRKIIEDQEYTELTKEDAVGLDMFMKSISDVRDYEQDIMFKFGLREAYDILKNLDLIKDGN